MSSTKDLQSVSRESFCQRLHQSLQEENNPEDLRWTSHDTFLISSNDLKARTALDKYFEFNSLASFSRQINYYGFTRITDRRRRTTAVAPPATSNEPVAAINPISHILFTHRSGFFTRTASPETLNLIIRKTRNRNPTGALRKRKVKPTQRKHSPSPEHDARRGEHRDWPREGSNDRRMWRNVDERHPSQDQYTPPLHHPSQFETHHAREVPRRDVYSFNTSTARQSNSETFSTPHRYEQQQQDHHHHPQHTHNSPHHEFDTLDSSFMASRDDWRSDSRQLPLYAKSTYLTPSYLPAPRFNNYVTPPPSNYVLEYPNPSSQMGYGQEQMSPPFLEMTRTSSTINSHESPRSVSPVSHHALQLSSDLYRFGGNARSDTEQRYSLLNPC